MAGRRRQMMVSIRPNALRVRRRVCGADREALRCQARRGSSTSSTTTSTPSTRARAARFTSRFPSRAAKSPALSPAPSLGSSGCTGALPSATLVRTVARSYHGSLSGILCFLRMCDAMSGADLTRCVCVCELFAAVRVCNATLVLCRVVLAA